jgi:hypothetical protein
MPFVPPIDELAEPRLLATNAANRRPGGHQSV